MSIRQRLIVVVVLAGVTLVAAIASILHILSTTEAARLDAAQSHAHAAAASLADEFTGRDPSLVGSLAVPSAELLRVLRAQSAASLSSLPRGEGGFCTRDALVVVARPRRADPKVALSPEHRAVVERACAESRGERTVPLRAGDTLALSVVPVDGGAAWVALPVRPKGDDEPTHWQLEVAILALGTLGLVALSLDALFALQRGASQLDDSLQRLGRDLRAPVATPRAAELATIAAGLAGMARRLAEAHERERSMATDLAHQERLAGLGRVVAGVAHEIRNPLAGIKLRLDLLARAPRDGTLGATVDEDVRACLDEIVRLDRVVRSLLVVARRDPPVRTRVELGALVDERLALGRELAEERGVTLVRRGDVALDTDRDALGRIVDNLLRNAIEASPRTGEVAITLAADAEQITVDVADDGAGIAAGRERELFEPFFTTKPEGTGLGLWLSRTLCETLGGTLEHTRHGERTHFRVVLPRVVPGASPGP